MKEEEERHSIAQVKEKYRGGSQTNLRQMLTLSVNLLINFL